jgi:uncharacterized protein YifE (UPF0438 family)
MLTRKLVAPDTSKENDFKKVLTDVGYSKNITEKIWNLYNSPDS